MFWSALYSSNQPVVEHMFLIIRKQLKIFNPIIVFNTINMVNRFSWFKETIQIFFHNKTMFSNAIIFVTKWMIWRINRNVSSKITATPFPIWMFFFRIFCSGGFHFYQSFTGIYIMTAFIPNRFSKVPFSNFFNSFSCMSFSKKVVSSTFRKFAQKSIPTFFRAGSMRYEFLIFSISTRIRLKFFKTLFTSYFNHSKRIARVIYLAQLQLYTT
mgnify:CR=1 FL=1